MNQPTPQHPRAILLTGAAGGVGRVPHRGLGRARLPRVCRRSPARRPPARRRPPSPPRRPRRHRPRQRRSGRGRRGGGPGGPRPPRGREQRRHDRPGAGRAPRPGRLARPVRRQRRRAGHRARRVPAAAAGRAREGGEHQRGHRAGGGADDGPHLRQQGRAGVAVRRPPRRAGALGHPGQCHRARGHGDLDLRQGRGPGGRRARQPSPRSGGRCTHRRWRRWPRPTPRPPCTRWTGSSAPCSPRSRPGGPSRATSVGPTPAP